MALSAFASQLGISSMDDLSVFFLAEGEQSADDVMARLTTFIHAAKQTLAFAIYDMRFSDPLRAQLAAALRERADRKSTRLNSSHSQISYAVFCLKKKKK